VAIDCGTTLHVALVLRNATANPEEVTLTVALPPGWTEKQGSARYALKANDAYPVPAAVIAPANVKPEWQEITWKAEAGGRETGKVAIRVFLGEGGGIPQ
jgi:hypothetical protein